jgi:hypothetical protein
MQLPAIMQWVKQTFAGAAQSAHGEDEARLGRPVLVEGAGRGATGRGRGGRLGVGGCGG